VRPIVRPALYFIVSAPFAPTTLTPPGKVVRRNLQKDIFMLHPRARTMLLLSIPAIVIGIAASLVLIVAMKTAAMLQNILWSCVLVLVTPDPIRPPSHSLAHR